MDFGKLESVSSDILNPTKNFAISNTVILGQKDYKTKGRKNSLREGTFKSKKYADCSTLGRLDIDTSCYLVFSSRKHDGKRVEIWSSYPHMSKIKTGFTKALRVAKKEGFYKDEDGYHIKPDYLNWMQNIKPLVRNACITIILAEVEEEVAGRIKYKKGVEILFNDEEASAIMDITDFEGVVYFLKDFNLLLSSQNLTTQAYINQLTVALDLEPVEFESKTINVRKGKAVKKKIKKREESSLISPEELGPPPEEGFMLDDGEPEEIQFK